MSEIEQPPEVEAVPEAKAKAKAPAPDMSGLEKPVLGYHANEPIGALLRALLDEAGVPAGNLPAADGEPVISMYRADSSLRGALDDLARMCGATWKPGAAGVDFTLGG
jgi:hypothetical protein